MTMTKPTKPLRCTLGDIADAAIGCALLFGGLYVGLWVL